MKEYQKYSKVFSEYYVKKQRLEPLPSTVLEKDHSSSTATSHDEIMIIGNSRLAGSSPYLFHSQNGNKTLSQANETVSDFESEPVLNKKPLKRSIRSIQSPLHYL